MFKVHVIASSSIGWLLHHHFIYAKSEELDVVSPKKFRLYIVQFKSTLKDAKLQK